MLYIEKTISVSETVQASAYSRTVFKLSEAVLELLIPTLMALLIDNGVNMGNRSYIIKMGILMLVIATFGVIFAFICQYSASIASQGFGTDVRNAMFQKNRYTVIRTA